MHGYADLIGKAIQVVSNRCITTCFPNICTSEDISWCQISRVKGSISALFGKKKIIYLKTGQGENWDDEIIIKFGGGGLQI